MIEYVGEQLIFGKIGNAFVSVSFVGALFASVLFFIHSRNQERNDLKKLARGFFTAHAISVFGIFFLLMYLIFNHRFEYHYVWQHSNTIMPMRYIFRVIIVIALKTGLCQSTSSYYLLHCFFHSVLQRS